MTEPLLLTPDEAAAMLRVTRARVLALVRGGAIGSVKVGERTIRIPRSALDLYIRGAYNPARDEEGASKSARQRAGVRLPRGRRTPEASVVRDRDSRVDARRRSGPPIPIRRVEG